jgi:osmotically-inducible protein OsmY
MNIAADSQIERDCRFAIERAGLQPGVHLVVTQGWVCMRGTVRRAAERWTVEAAASGVHGVVGVNAQLRVSAVEPVR